MRNEQIRGQFSTTLAGSALDAAPFSLTGAPTEKPEYFQQRYTLTLGGPVKIPAINKGTSRTTFFVNYNGNHSATPFDVLSTVPTAAARGGDFSSLGLPVIDPQTGVAFPGNQIPQSRVESVVARTARVLSAAEPAGRQPELPLHLLRCHEH